MRCSFISLKIGEFLPRKAGSRINTKYIYLHTSQFHFEHVMHFIITYNERFRLFSSAITFMDLIKNTSSILTIQIHVYRLNSLVKIRFYFIVRSNI